MALQRIGLLVHALLLLGACGRTPTSTTPDLMVQVVDEADDAVGGAEVDLAMTGEPRVLGSARTDGYGVATFAYPGNGTYELAARTDLTCCYREGTLEVTLLDPNRIIILPTATGPCPTAIPPDCP